MQRICQSDKNNILINRLKHKLNESVMRSDFDLGNPEVLKISKQLDKLVSIEQKRRMLKSNLIIYI